MAGRRSERTEKPPPGNDAIRLSRAVARGDREALAEFYSAWFDRCYAAARSITGRDEAFCLDVVQEAMLRVVKSIRPMRSAGELEGWMLRVVGSAAVDCLRRESRRTRRERAVAAKSHAAAGPEMLLAADEAADWVRAAVDALPADDRALIADRFGRARTLEQAATSAGMSGGAAHGRLRRTLARLGTLAKEVFDER